MKQHATAVLFFHPVLVLLLILILLVLSGALVHQVVHHKKL